MTDDRVFLFVNGIRTKPADSTAWTDRATAWFINRRIFATDYEYWAFALTRRVTQNFHADQLAKKIEGLTAKRMVLVGHSNGCDLILRALRDCRRHHVDHVFLIAGACDERYDVNGANGLLRRNEVGKFWNFCSEADTALGLAKKTEFLRFVNLGYGWLGLVGPKNVPEEFTFANATRVHTEWFPNCGHGDYFKGERFETTMRYIETASRLTCFEGVQAQ